MPVSYKLNLTETGRPYPHYWELCVGSCHAATILREDVREHIRKAHAECGFEYLRFHGLLDDDMSVVIEPMFFGEAQISFFNIDSVFDFLLDTGMKPFVEIGFMPEAFASGPETVFHYRGNITPPKDYDQWAEFIRLFGQHLLDRYGKDEVSRWFFEVWNEPNLAFFFSGSQNEYFKLYKTTAETLKSVDPCFRVGGPATSNNAWVADFVDFCRRENVPVDFVSTHHYPSDDPLQSFGKNDETQPVFSLPSKEELEKMTPEEIGKLTAAFGTRENKNPRDILLQMTKKAKAEAGDLPLYYTEWNGSKEFDTSYQAAAVVHTLSQNEGLVEGYSFWTVSDIFEEMGLMGSPFNDAFGIQTIHGIPKPSYRVFETLHQAGSMRLDVDGSHATAEVLALKDGSRVTVLVYNHDIERRCIKAEDIELTLQGRIRSIHKAVIDDTHTNPLGAWQAMGSPKYPTPEQLAVIRGASELDYELLDIDGSDSHTLTFTAEPESVTVLQIQI